MEELILVKLGGSVITDKQKEFTERGENIKRLAKEIKEGQKVFKGKIIIGHGAGSFAHTPAAKYQTKKGLINKDSLLGMALTEDAARKLNAIVVSNFLEENIPVFPFSPASFLISDMERGIGSYLDPIKEALRVGAIPVVYGDVILDKKQGCTIFSTEKVLSVVTKGLKDLYKIRMIYVTDVDGVYDDKGVTIPVISKTNFNRLKSAILSAKGVDVTGGMLHKVEEGLKMASEFNLEAVIINGTINGELRKAVLGEKTNSTKITG
jgi:isopentenyl phosphate kinase